MRWITFLILGMLNIGMVFAINYVTLPELQKIDRVLSQSFNYKRMA